MVDKKIFFLSGLPRSGSTLLNSILSQNPALHTEGNSALCQLMWDAQVSHWYCQQIINKPKLEEQLLSSIPEIFYSGITSNIIDKCRYWTLPGNLDLINKYLTKTPKIIVTLRPMVEVVRSFVHIRKVNNWENPESNLLDEGTDPIMRPYEGVLHSKFIDSGQFLYVWYDDLVNEPQSVLNNIYEFCGWEKFNHTFTNIKNPNPEKDDSWGLIGLHDVRPKISKRNIEITLSKELYEKAIILDKALHFNQKSLPGKS